MSKHDSRISRNNDTKIQELKEQLKALREQANNIQIELNALRFNIISINKSISCLEEQFEEDKQP